MPDGHAAFQFHSDAFGRLVLTDSAGQIHVGVKAIRGFPISEPRQGVAICDASGREICWIDDLDQLPRATRQALEDDLARREFMPIIVQILAIGGATEPSEWEIDSDRGRTTILVNGDEDVRRLADDSALVIDTHGTRHLIRDLRTLDAGSKRLLERYL